MSKTLTQEQLSRLEQCSRILIKEPNNLKALCMHADLLRISGDYEHAEQDFTRANNLSPTNPNILKGRAATLLQLKRIDDAVQDIETANHIAPMDAFTLRVRGSIKFQLGYHHGALRDLNASDKLQKGHYYTLMYRAAIYYHIGDDKAALIDLQESIADEDYHALAHYYMGLVLWRQHEDSDKTEHYLYMATTLEPDNPDYQKTLHSFRQDTAQKSA